MIFQGTQSLKSRALQVPEARVVILGFGLSLTWEFLQSPFYADTFESAWSQVLYNRIHCTAGDVFILLGAFWAVALVWGRSWMGSDRWIPIATFIFIDLGYTAFSEYLNVHVLDRWSYSAWMPVVSGIGLLPMAQWIVIPGLLVWLYNKSGNEKI